jgi:dihydroflavonol-4-reductase
VRIAITGATGHLGTVLVKELIQQGHQLKALVHLNTKTLEGLPVVTINGSVNEVKPVNELVRDTDAVIHAAALISIDGDRRGLVREVNVAGVKNMLDAAVKWKVKKFVHVSSIHVYRQWPSSELLNEAMPFVSEHASPYDASKRDGQMLVLEYVKQGLDAVIVNPTSVVGPPDYKPS